MSNRCSLQAPAKPPLGPAPSMPSEHQEDKLSWLDPVKETTELHEWDVWWSTCGRYRVIRAMPHSWFSDEPRFIATRGKLHLLGSAYRTLRVAFEACEKDLTSLISKPVDSGINATLSRARELGLDSLQQTKPTSPTVPKVQETDLVSLAEAPKSTQEGFSAPKEPDTTESGTPETKRGGGKKKSSEDTEKVLAQLSKSEELSVPEMVRRAGVRPVMWKNSRGGEEPQYGCFYLALKKMVEKGVVVKVGRCYKLK